MTEMATQELVVEQTNGETYWLGDSKMTIIARGGTHGLTLIHWTSPPGSTAPLHVHHDLDDNFFIIDGQLTVWCGGRISQAGSGNTRAGSAAEAKIRVAGSGDGAPAVANFSIAALR